MFTRSTLAAFLVAAALAGYYFAFERSRSDSTTLTLNQKLTELKVERIVRILLEPRDGPKVEMTRKLGARNWYLGSQGLTDRKATHGMYQALHNELLYGALEGDPKSFGLAPPALKVTLTDADDKQAVLLFGDADPGGRRRYLMRDGKPGINLIPTRAYDAFNLLARDLRDTRVFQIEQAEQVARITITQQGPPWSLVRDGAHWRVDPLGDRAVPDAQSSLLRLLAMRALEFMPDKPLSSISATILLTLKDNQTSKLEIGPYLPATRSHLVRLAPRKELMRVLAAYLAPLLRGANKLRAQNLLPGPRGPQLIQRLEFGSLIAERDGDAWKLDHGKLPGFSIRRVQSLVDALDSGRIETFLDGKPRITHELVIQKKWDEQSERVTLRIGSLDGKPCLQIAGRPGTMRVGTVLAMRLTEARLALRSTTLLTLPPTSVTRLECDGKLRDRTEEKWKALLLRLDNLSVERFVPGSIEKPQRIYKLRTTDGKTHVLLIGKDRVSVDNGPVGLVSKALLKGLLPELQK